jgi:hypothetical protein
MAELHIFPAPDQVLPGWVTRAGRHQEPVWAWPEQVWRDLKALGHPGTGRVGLGPGMEASDLDLIDKKLIGRLIDLHGFQEKSVGLIDLVGGQEELALPIGAEILAAPVQVNPVRM